MYERVLHVVEEEPVVLEAQQLSTYSCMLYPTPKTMCARDADCRGMKQHAMRGE